ncbi:3-oxoacyl-[acyl-carrier-protein] synthase III C-terminal domain-containing protein [Actinomadura sp. NEAU-AAG7]|uniref:3-oxoacyl-[acyl-carrier-protein] synthase III C-terminal domain-containing protein n=1 Tax=Actinomadura sp. NEAU-AAG7 TaxID=2839640 RepID=UPI001BE42B9D|nr:3-oxoacyl-[acyl-carrier-protein] synthase III C-terminal domain-containing protein [Actinomadura sp. NEAU-AAG7]MBT2208106.1 hypothetical protein [Actinomadura sp. NEAU-AAG7]
MRAGGSEQRLSAASPDPDDRYFTMEGKEVFWHAVQRMAESARTTLGSAGLTVEDVDWLVGHQANSRILRSLAGELGIPSGRSLTNIDRVGNTAAASIPLALADAHAEGRLRAGQRVLLTAFGGGLTWGSALLTWPDIECVP